MAQLQNEICEVALARATSPILLAIDIGSSSVRAALFDGRGREVVATQARRAWSFRTADDGSSEADAEELLAIVVAVIDEALSRSPQDLTIEAVAISCFWHSLVALDRNGRPLTPIFGWADTRARHAARALRSRLDESEFHRRTGCRFHASYWPAKIVWLREHHPTLFAEVGRFVSFSEFLTDHLLDRSAMSVSMASGTGLFDQRGCAWEERLLAELRLRPEQLPDLVDAQDLNANLRAEFSKRWPQLRHARWFAPFADGAVSNVGEGSLECERAVIMIGTSGAMRVIFAGEPPEDLPSSLWSYRVDRRRVVIGGALSDGGNLREWLCRSLMLDEATLDAELARLAPSGHGLTVLPFWSGERSTGWHDEARGAILGLSLHTRPIEIARAVMEAICYRFAAIADALRVIAPIEEWIASGGTLQRSVFWTQMLADILEQPVGLSGVREASSRGAALLALEAMGQLRLCNVRPIIVRRFEPEAERASRYRAARARHERSYRLILEAGDSEHWRSG